MGSRGVTNGCCRFRRGVKAVVCLWGQFTDYESGGKFVCRKLGNGRVMFVKQWFVQWVLRASAGPGREVVESCLFIVMKRLQARYRYFGKHINENFCRHVARPFCESQSCGSTQKEIIREVDCKFPRIFRITANL